MPQNLEPKTLDKETLGEIVYKASYPDSSITYRECCWYEKHHCERIGSAVYDAIISALAIY